MVKTSRNKRPLDREREHFRDARFVIIATEGKETEKQYFEASFFKHKRVHVKVLPTEDGLSSRQHVFNRLLSFKEEFELNQNDRLWLVIDRDRWEQKNLINISQ